MLEVIQNMSANELSAAFVFFGLCIIAVVGTVGLFYSPAQYSELKRLYKEQVELDNKVYEWRERASLPERLWFSLTTKDVGHYDK